MKVCNKLLILSSALSVVDAQGVVPWLRCKRFEGDGNEREYFENCNQINQLDCAPGVRMPIKVEFTHILLCDTNDVSSSTRLRLRGSAIRSIHHNETSGEDFTGLTIPWGQMNDLGKPNCYKRSYETEIDQCASHFNAMLIADTADAGSAPFYDTYMKRKCDFEATVTCSHNGTSCNEIDDCSSESLQYDYEYCIGTSYKEHGITIETFYGLNETVPYDCSPLCKKTIAWIGNFEPEKIFSAFPNFSTIGPSEPDGKKCWTKSITRTSCQSGKIPGASIEAFGKVTFADGPNAAAVTEFQGCSASASIPPVYFSSDTGSRVKSPAGEGTKSPAGKGGKGTKSPAGKGGKGTKSPAGKGGGTKSPAGKGGKGGTTSPAGKGGKGTKSPAGKGKGTAGATSKSPSPLRTPSVVPSTIPSKTPSILSSPSPSKTPSKSPSQAPSKTPSKSPSKVPSATPSMVPSCSNNDIIGESFASEINVPSFGTRCIRVEFAVSGRLEADRNANTCSAATFAQTAHISTVTSIDFSTQTITLGAAAGIFGDSGIITFLRDPTVSVPTMSVVGSKNIDPNDQSAPEFELELVLPSCS